MKPLRRGEVWWVDLAPRSGSEQRGRRPAVVVSHDSFNEVTTWRSILVVPVTTSPKQKRRGPTAVPIFSELSGLPRESIALCHQITTLDRAKFIERAGYLSEGNMMALNDGLVAALALLP